MCLHSCKKEDDVTTESKAEQQNNKSPIAGIFVQYESYKREQYPNGTIITDEVQSGYYPQSKITFYENNHFLRSNGNIGSNEDTGSYTYNSKTGEIVLSNFNTSPGNPTMYYNMKQFPYDTSINVTPTTQSGNIIYWNTQNNSNVTSYYQKRYKQVSNNTTGNITFKTLNTMLTCNVNGIEYNTPKQEQVMIAKGTSFDNPIASSLSFKDYFIVENIDPGNYFYRSYSSIDGNSICHPSWQSSIQNGNFNITAGQNITIVIL